MAGPSRLLVTTSICLGCSMLASCSDVIPPVDLPPVDDPGSGPVELRSATSDAHQEEPSIAVLPNGRIVAAWKEMPSPASVGSLGLGWSDDNGDTWTTGSLPPLSGSPGQSDPWLSARASGRLVAAHFADCQVGISTSDDGAVSWSAWTDLHEGDGCADKPSLSASPDLRLYAAYHVIELSGSVRIDLRSSSDDGMTWAMSTTVAQAASGVRLAPSVVALPGQGVAVAWWSPDTGNIETSRSDDGGNTWSVPSQLNSEAGSVPRVQDVLLRPPFPILAGTGATLVAVWPDHASDTWDVVAARSTDGGRTWSPPSTVSPVTAGDQWMITAVVGADGIVHAAWYDSSEGPTELHYATSEDGGSSWSLARGQGNVVDRDRARLGDYMSIAVGPNGAAYVAWTAVRNDSLRVFASSASGLTPS